MVPAREFQVDAGEIAIQVAEWPGAGRDVVAIHGLTANLRCFETIAEGMQGAHHLWAMDLRGRGLSGKPATGYSMAHHCRDIKAVLEGLGLPRVVLMGHSLGAYISFSFAATHPEMTAGIILLDGGGELTPPQWAKVAEGIQPSVDRLGKVLPSWEAYFEMARQSPYYRDWNQAIESFFRYDAEAVPGGVSCRVQPQNIAEERNNLGMESPAKLQALVKCPVLVVRAAKGMVMQDRLLLPKDAYSSMLRTIPQARGVELQDADHFSMTFHPNPARDEAIRNFLTDLR